MPPRGLEGANLCCAPKTSRSAANRFKASLPQQGERQKDAQHQAKLEGTNDARTGMPFGIPKGAMCVQRFDDSLNSAIHTTYRISLRSSSMPEPRDPLRSEEHTSELQSRQYLVCRLLLEKK